MRCALMLIPVLLVAGVASGWYMLRPRDPLAQARSLMEHGDLHGAQLALRDLVRSQPGLPEAQLRLGQVQLRLGDPVAAEHALRAAAEHGADEHAVRPLMAMALVGENRGDVVLREDTADGLDPSQAAGLHVARAMAAAEGQQRDLAAREAAAAVEAAPRSPEVLLDVARVERASGDLDGASGHVDTALSLDGRLVPALMLRGQILAQRGDPAGAIAALGAALAATPPGEGAQGAIRLERAGLLLARGDDAGALADVNAVLKASPRDPAASYLLATLEMRAGRWKAADEALTRVGPVLERFTRGDVLLALVKAHLDQPHQALDAAERFCARNSDDRGGAKLLATLYLAQRQLADADRLLARWSGPGRSDADFLALQSTRLALEGKPGQAEDALRAAIRPDDPDSFGRLAAVALQQGEAALAAQALETSLDRGMGTVVDANAGAGTDAKAGVGQRPGATRRAQTADALVTTLLQAGQLDKAEVALASLLEAHGDPQRVNVLTGAVRLARFDISGARAAFEAAHAREPDSVPVVVDLARVMQLQGEGEGAAALLRNALARHPADGALVSSFASLALARHDTDAAVTVAEAANKAAPADQGLAIGLSELYLRTGQPAPALELARTLGDQSARGLGLQADAERALGHSNAALADWTALLKLVPQDVALRRRIVGFLLAARRGDAAEPILRDGLAAHPDDPGLQSDAVALAEQQGGVPAALARADGFAGAGDPQARLLKGDLLMATRRFDDAAAAFAVARAGLPAAATSVDGEQLLLRQAGALIAGGDRAGGIKLMQDWQAAHADAFGVTEALAENDIAAGKLAEARTKLDAVLKAQPDDAVNLNNLAWVEQKEGDTGGAVLHAGRAYRLMPTPQAADTLGWALLAGGQAGDALPLLREAGAGLAHDASVQFHLASALARNGRSEDAKAVLKPVLDSSDRFSERGDAEQLMQTLGKS